MPKVTHLSKKLNSKARVHTVHAHACVEDIFISIHQEMLKT